MNFVALEFWHFGDTDPEGFDILCDLRERSGRTFRALHMQPRASVDSESLKPGEKRLLRTLMGSALMQGEHEMMRQMLEAGTKGNFEQESLGTPKRRSWPFYVS